MTLLTMPHHNPTPDQQLEDAWQMLRAHRLMSDVDLKNQIVDAWAQKNKRFWLLSLTGVAATGALQSPLLFLVVSGILPDSNVDKAILFVVVMSLTLVGFWSIGFYNHLQSKRECAHAQEAIDRRDYSSKTLAHAFRYSDITPLKKDDWNWQAVSDSLKSGDDLELSTIWGKWLLSELPIREMDVEAIQLVRCAKKKSDEWHEEQKNPHEQQEGRRLALGLLPAELVSSLKAERLQQRLEVDMAISDGPRPRL